MTVAVVHALSMNVRDAGRITPPQPAFAGTSAAFSWRGLTASTAYLIDWGEGSPDTTASSNGSGVLASTHTYGAAGRYDVTLRNSGNTADIKQVSLSVGGGFTIPDPITEDVEASFGFALRPATTYKVFWGDDEDDEFTTTAGTNEVQTVSLTGTPAGGSFTAAIAGASAITIPYNASVSAVQALVDARATLKGNVVVGGSTGAWTFTYVDDLGFTNVVAPTLNSAGLTGGTSPAAGVVTNTAGVAAGTATVAHTYAAVGDYSITVEYEPYDEVVATTDIEVEAA